MSSQGSHSMTPTSPFSPAGGDDRQWHAASLAELIRSGALDVRQSPSKGSRHSSASMSRQHSQQSEPTPVQQPFVPQRPLVQSWSDHMITMEPEPPFLDEAKRGTMPSVKELTDHSPFVEPCLDQWQPSTHGVLYVKNIPYGTLKNEVASAIGRTAKIITQPRGTGFEAIHIIMDRSTGKTMDCYVELANVHEAYRVYERFRHRCMTGKSPRIQDRHVQVEVVDQGALMEELFPRAKCVTWDNQVPIIFTPNEAYDSGFHGFLTSEEMTMTLKHALTPNRSPFANRNLQRPYENMISTLNKFPWFATNHITIEDRCLLFNITFGLLQHLMRSLDRKLGTLQLTRELLQQLLCSALTVPFSQQQKCRIVSLMHESHYGEMVETTPYQSLGSIGQWWPFEVLDKKRTVQVVVVEYYVSLIRQATSGPDGRGQLAMQACSSPSPFGDIKLSYGTSDIANMTLSDVAVKERDTINSLIIKAVRAHNAAAGLTVVHESPDLGSGEFGPSDHDVFDKYSAPLSPRSGSDTTSCQSPDLCGRPDSFGLDRGDVLSNHSGSGNDQLSPTSLDGGMYYQPQPLFNRTPGFGRLNAASAPFNPRSGTGTGGVIPIHRAGAGSMIGPVGIGGPDTCLPPDAAVGYVYGADREGQQPRLGGI